MRAPGARALLAALLVALGAGGQSLACGSDPAQSKPSGAICLQDSTLSYENFGRPFMEKYCTRCHSSELHGADRNGAPLYHDFDSLLGIVLVGDHVDEYTAAGPDSSNSIMPPDGAKPTIEERTDLGVWLACELLRINDRPDAGPGADAALPDGMPTFQ
jgi:hypothetical protein